MIDLIKMHAWSENILDISGMVFQTVYELLLNSELPYYFRYLALNDNWLLFPQINTAERISQFLKMVSEADEWLSSAHKLRDLH